MATAKRSRTEGTVALTDRLPNETNIDYVRRLAGIGTAEAVATAEGATLAADDAARLATFEDRVMRSVMAGLTAVAKATLADGKAPADYAAVAKAVGISADGGEYLGRKYSTLRECYRLANGHTAEAMEAFAASYREATGRNPEQLRQYVQWCTARSEGDRTVGTIVKREAAVAKAKAEAEAETVKRRETEATLRKAGTVKGCALTAAEWRSMSEATLREVAILANALAVDLGKASRKAAAEAKAAEAAAETGPTPRRKSRAKVAA